MATSPSLLQGEVSTNPINLEVNLELMMEGFLRSLILEQQKEQT